MMEFLTGHFTYLVVAMLMMSGMFIVFASRNLVKRMIGLAIFQTSVGVFFIALSKVAGGTAPILINAQTSEFGSRVGQRLAGRLDPAYVARVGVDGVVYANPLPHVLILTAIVVGVATLAVGLAIAVRVREAYGSIEADEVEAADAAGSAAAT